MILHIGGHPLVELAVVRIDGIRGDGDFVLDLADDVAAVDVRDVVRTGAALALRHNRGIVANRPFLQQR
jgi:hypothetical protein